MSPLCLLLSCICIPTAILYYLADKTMTRPFAGIVTDPISSHSFHSTEYILSFNWPWPLQGRTYAATCSAAHMPTNIKCIHTHHHRTSINHQTKRTPIKRTFLIRTHDHTFLDLIVPGTSQRQTVL